MKLIEAKCPECKELITVDGDSDTTKCESCGEKINVKDAIVEMLMSAKEETNNNIDQAVIEEEINEPEFVEEVEEAEEIEEIEEEPVKEKKKQTSKGKKSTEFDKYLQQADAYFSGNQYDKAYDYYVKALEIKPDDKYAEYRTALINLSHNMTDRSKLLTTYDRLLEVDYCFDDEEKVTEDTTALIMDFVNFIYNHAKNRYSYIQKEKDSTLNEIKSEFNLWYLDLYLFEKMCTEESITEEIKETVLVYIINLINYLQGVYRYHDEGGRFGPANRDFQDLNNYDTLMEKRNKYANELIKIDDSYRNSIKAATPKKNQKSLNRSYSTPLGWLKQGFKEAWWFVLACFVYFMLHYLFDI